VVGELPSGTVTFLFTDVEGSTRLLGQLRERYGVVLADHRRLLRAAFAEHEGQEIDVQGDAFFVVFRRAKDAAAAAVAAQRALSSHEWPPQAVVRVRMGLHTGEPFVGEEGYLGLAVHRAARICSAGHGGQILLSRSTCAVLEDDEPDGATLRDLGEHQLKDFDREERIYELVVDGLAEDSAPLRTLDSQPTKATPFAGQETELAQAAQAAVASSRRSRFVDAAQPLRGDRMWQPRFSLLRHAAWRALLRPANLLIQTIVVIAAIVVDPWLLIVGALAYAALVWAEMLRLHASGLEELGWRVRMAARIAPDTHLRDEISALASALIRAGQTGREVDAYLKAVDRKRLAHQLAEQRGVPVVSQEDLEIADTLARKISAIDRLVDQRRRSDSEIAEAAGSLTELPGRLYQARLHTELVDELTNEVREARDRVDAARVQLDAASDAARRYEPQEVGRSWSYRRRLSD
jgi:class 3 adenylate cyclase